MKTYIALLKGINVGGHKKVPMAELHELLSKSGFKNVKTYIQSGNVVFDYKETASNKLQKMIFDKIQEDYIFAIRNEYLLTMLKLSR